MHDADLKLLTTTSRNSKFVMVMPKFPRLTIMCMLQPSSSLERFFSRWRGLVLGVVQSCCGKAKVSRLSEKNPTQRLVHLQASDVGCSHHPYALQVLTEEPHQYTSFV